MRPAREGSGGKHPDKNTSRLHEHLLDAVRFTALTTMRERWPEKYGGMQFTMLPEGSPFAGMLPWSPYEYRPDVTAWFEHDGAVELVAVEIGTVHQRGWCPVVHVSFYGGVAILDAAETGFEEDLMRATRAAVNAAMVEWAGRGLIDEQLAKRQEPK